MTLLLIGSAHADSAKTALTGELAQRFNAISDQLVCQCSCRMILGVCNHQNCPSGIPIRQEIEAMLQQGKTDDEIVGAFVSRMGKIVLSAPPAKGGYWIAWILPFVVLAGGGLWLGRWLEAKNREQTKNPPPPAATLTKEEEEKFKKEWSQWNQQS